MLFVGRGARGRWVVRAAGACGAAAQGPGLRPVRAELAWTMAGEGRWRLGPAAQPRRVLGGGLRGRAAPRWGGVGACWWPGRVVGRRRADGDLGESDRCVWAGGMGLGYFYAYWEKKKDKGTILP